MKKKIINIITEVKNDKELDYFEKKIYFDKKLRKLEKLSLYFSIFSLIFSLYVFIYYTFFKQ